MSQKLYRALVASLALSLSAFAQNQSHQPNPVQGTPDFSIAVNAPLVTLDVRVVSKEGVFIPGLRQQNFRVLEDGVPQTITSFSQAPAPITAAILVECPKGEFIYEFAHNSLVDSYAFAQVVRTEDWISLITYDLQEHTLQDSTRNKQAVAASISTVRPGMVTSQETNLFDALYNTLDRLQASEGRKYIILVSTGRDTSSKRTLNQVLKKVQASRDVVIYSISTGQALRNYLGSRGGLRALCPISDFECARILSEGENHMQLFARISGGKFYRPVFAGRMKDAFLDIGNSVRNQYVVAYHPTNRAQDGSLRRIKVELTDDRGGSLRMGDNKGREVKYEVVTREGYTAIQQEH
jgi:VWFA-related protein